MKKSIKQKTHPMNLRIPVDMYEALIKLANQNGTNVAIEARNLIKNGLKMKEKVYKDALS